MPEHFLSIRTCSDYQSPQENVKPFQINPGCEVVEVLTDGKIIWDEEGMEQTIYLPGTIFWHREGDWTIHRSPPGALYHCVVVHINVPAGQPRQCARIGHWNSPLNMKAFLDDVLNIFHSGRMKPDDFVRYAVGVLQRQMAVAPHNDMPQSVIDARAAIDDNLKWNFTAEELARQYGLSKPHLYALFRRHLNRAPHQYQLEQRIHHARRLLASRNLLSIKEISAECGFSDIEVFYRHFKRSVGLTPNQYRKQQLAFY